MSKIGILTFHYTNNYGGILQALSLQRAVELQGYNVEIINFVPKEYNPISIKKNLGIKKRFFSNRVKDLNPLRIMKKIWIIKYEGTKITNKFHLFRSKEMKLSKQINENTFKEILKDYQLIIVGSDQVWNPSERAKNEYFLNYNDYFMGKRISYAADSTIEEVKHEDRRRLSEALSKFDYISVRNEHSFKFIKSILNKEVDIVADPTLIYDYKCEENNTTIYANEYILMYILGSEIEGTHSKVIEEIRDVYGELPVYSIRIPTMNFEMDNFANKTFYNLDPNEWISMIKNAKFVYTDSFHGVMFSLKYNKPFLAYYTEKMRASRFIDMGKRYGIERYIVESLKEIKEKRSIEVIPNFELISNILENQKKESLKILKKTLKKFTIGEKAEEE